MAPAVIGLDTGGNILWTTLLAQGQAGHGGVRSCIMDNTDLVCAGYVGEDTPSFKFVADVGSPTVWRLDTGVTGVSRPLALPCGRVGILITRSTK